MKTLATLSLLAVSLAASAQTARLSLQSEPGDYIGAGQNWDITWDVADGDTVSAQISRRLNDGSPAELLFFLYNADYPTPNEFALLFFGTDQLGIPIQPGVYEEARRADFAPPGYAGLDVSFQNRGSNEVYGSFEITEVTFDAALEQVLTFEASFEQHSESPNAPALYGQFRYDAQPVPEPATLAALGLGALALARRRKKG